VKKNIIFVIPALNEERCIKKVILDFKKIGKTLVVNDNSKDKTKYLASKYSNYIINNKRKLGYDKSLRIGLKYAVTKIKNCNIIFSIDGDGQHQSKSVDVFLKKIIDNDIVIGKRQFFNRFAEYLIGFFSNILDGISDPLCGMKCYKKNQLIYLLKNLKYDSDYIGMFFLKKKIKYSEVNIKVKENKLTRFGSGFKANMQMIFAYIKIKFKLI